MKSNGGGPAGQEVLQSVLNVISGKQPRLPLWFSGFFYFYNSFVVFCYNIKMNQRRIGVLRGGTGENYENSLRAGGEIISYILENLSSKFKVVDILIDRDGEWHLGGIPIKVPDLIHRVDVVWDMTGNVSGVLESFSIPRVGAGSFSYSLLNNRAMLEQHLKSVGVSMPRRIVLPLYQKDFDGPRERYAIKKAKEVHEKFAGPWTIKPFTPNGDMAIHVATTFPELVDAIEDGVSHGGSILVEELIMGKNTTVHSMSNFREEDIYVFPPENISVDEKEKIISSVRNLHKHINAKHYLKSDFVLNSRGKIYLLDFESTPNLKPFSHFSEACEQVGAKMHNVVEHILERAM